jgi:hypothetical protein
MRINFCGSDSFLRHVLAQRWVLICSYQKFDSVVERLHKALGHFYDRARHNLFFVRLEEFGLFMRLELYLFKVWLTASHSNY